MSKSSDALELAIVRAATTNDKLPTILPKWMLNLGIRPNARIIKTDGIGSKDKNNKTDVYIELENSQPLKISAKLSNADYFGNWYGHIRFLQEFGSNAFVSQTNAATLWANWWMTQPQSNIFVGVSICYGRRKGHTGQDFLDIYTYNDILSICRGFGNGIHVANCIYSSSHHPNSLQDILTNLQPINEDIIKNIVGDFKVAYRPINPLTEGTNRGKNVYTKFKPFHKLPTRTEITSTNSLFKLGKFVEVEPTRLNHNHILDELDSEYNIYIPRKPLKK
ncbi:hypothetical protein [Clostridium sporogenes]|uniref:hypothetical protein n=1 Tax=Clostridium sporogenes TaxID=1509 RepID=UPI001F1880F6|nr:hypothetical protein [Clostridium sporogenes]UJA31382.1 hypothetical protein L0894_14860 [Clostridium sporogenes]